MSELRTEVNRCGQPNGFSMLCLTLDVIPIATKASAIVAGVFEQRAD